MKRTRIALISEISLGLVLLFSTGSQIADAEEQQDSHTDREQVSRWITKLGDPSYTVRCEATKLLIASETEAIDLIVEATTSRDQEVSRRSVSVLSTLIARSSRSCEAFIEIVESDDPFAERALLTVNNPSVWSGIEKHLNARLRVLLQSKESGKAQKLVEQAECLAAKCGNSFDYDYLGTAKKFYVLKEQLRLNPEIDLNDFTAETLSKSKSKDLAMYVLSSARLDLLSGHLTDAKEKAQAVGAMELAYGLFEDNPELLLEDIQRAAPGR